MDPRPLVALGALAALAVLPLTACGDDPPSTDATTAPIETTVPETGGSTSAAPTSTAPPTTTAPDPATQLDGRTYLSTAVTGYTLVDGTEIAVSFDGANISANGGCNTLGSTWSLEGDVLVVPEMRSTMMACEPAALMDQDIWLSSVLTSRPTVALDGDTLTITAQGATVTIVDKEAVDPDRPLEGTTWTLESTISADAVSSLPAGAAPAA